MQAVARVRAPVAALLDEHQSSLAQLLGQLPNELPDAAKAGHAHVLAAVRVEAARVLTAGAYDEPRPELPDDRHDELRDRVGVGGVAGADVELDVDVEALAVSLPELQGVAELGV